MIKKILFLLLFCNVSFGQIVINELDADTPSTDVMEFIELKSSTPNFSLDGYVLVFFNAGNADMAYMSFDLDGLTTDINGIVTLGNSGVSPAPDRVINNNVIQNGPDAVAIYLGNPSDFINGSTVAHTTNLIDALVHKTNDANPTSLMAALGVAVAYDEYISAASLSDANSIQRKNDGTYETKAPTPDVPNDGSGVSFNNMTVTLSPTGNQTEPNSFTIVFTLSSNVTTTNLDFTYTLANGSFTTADYTGNLSVTIPVGSNSASRIIALVDDTVNEDDETMMIKLSALPSGYVKLNDDIEVRIHDNDFEVKPWGPPIAPTYGLCPNLTPSGYYDTLEGKSGNQLKQAIQDIIANPAVVREHNYAEVWDMLKEADQNPLNSSQVWLMYVEQPRSKLDQQSGPSGVGKWNREHIYCQSRGNFFLDDMLPNDGIDIWTSTDANDITAGGADGHHLRAEDGPENTFRNNKNYGLDPTGTDDYNGPAGTAGSWRGDVARALFYMAVRYNGLNVVNGFPGEPTGNIGDLATLLTWNTTDTADDYEMNHNNVIYNWQRNRNPFVDYPLLAEFVFGSRVGETWYSSLSNDDFASDWNIKIYPNPAKDIITISGLKQIAAIEVYSISGMKMYEDEYTPDSQLNLNLASGVYMLKITEDNKSTVKKLIVK
jgi:endonuclease I